MVLMDLQMPGMDGLEATRCIRDRSSRVLNRGIPIIAMTANAMKADEDRCREAGMDDFLAKPVQPLELLARIERWIAALGDIDAANRSQEAAQSEQPSAAAVASTAETLSLDPGQPPLRFDLLCRRVLDDRAAAVGLLRGAVDELDRSLTEIRRAVFDSNADATRQLAHRLKGLAANLSAEPLRGRAAASNRPLPRRRQKPCLLVSRRSRRLPATSALPSSISWNRQTRPATPETNYQPKAHKEIRS